MGRRLGGGAYEGSDVSSGVVMNKKRWPQADHYQEKLGVLTNINYSFTKAFFKFPISSFLWNLDGFFFFLVLFFVFQS